MSPSAPHHHLDAIVAAHHAALAANAVRATAFHLLPWGVSAKADWKGSDEPDFHATARQQAMMDVVQDLLDGGETELPLIALKLAIRLGCTESAILRSRDNLDADGESGFFYEDFLHALRALGAQNAHQSFNALMDRLVQPTYDTTRFLAD